MNKKIALIVCLSFMAMIGNSFALYDDIAVQGKLMNSTDDAQEGTFAFSFNIYDAYTGGASLYESNQTLTTDSGGIYNIVLSSVALNFSSDYYLGVNINDTGEMSPRINMTDVGNAIRSNETEYFNGLSSGSYLNDTDFSSAGIMKTDGGGVYSIVTDSSSNWNTAFGWGDHALAGYFVGVEANLNVNSSDNWDNLDTPMNIKDMGNITLHRVNATCCVYLGTIQATDGNSIAVQPTGDIDDYFSFKTPASRPTIKREGGKFIYFDSSNVYDVGISLRDDDTYSGTLNYEKDTHKMTLLGKASPVAIKTNSEYVNYFLFETYNHLPQMSAYNSTELRIADNLTVDGYIYAHDWTNVTITESQISDLTGDNTSWNQTYANTLYADISVTGDNTTWNKTYADTLYTANTGTVTSITTTAPIAGGTITTTGTISLTACSDTEIYKYNGTSSAWECEVDADAIGGNSTEEIQDAINPMFNGTETLISVTSQDATDSIDFVVNNDLHLYSWSNVVDADITNTLTVTGYMQDEDINTFAELQSWVTDKTLVNEEDIFTIDANWVNTANPWADNEVSDTLTCSDLVSGSSVVADTEVDNDITIASSANITSTAGIRLNDNVRIYLGTGDDSYIYDNGTALIIGRH